VRAGWQAPDGYDTSILAGDLAALMDALGHRRFTVAGRDTGMCRTAPGIRDVAHQPARGRGRRAGRG
jgi:pimeloyl-ACP methyl ester carboxylesterase